MQAKITYNLSQAAQLAQIKTFRQPVARTQTHVIEISPADIDLMSVDEAGNLSQDLDTYRGVNLHTDTVSQAATPEAAWEAYRTACRARQAKAAQERDEKEADDARRLKETEAADGAAAEWIDAQAGNSSMPKNEAMAAVGVKQPNWQAKLPLLSAALERMKERAAKEAEERKAEERAKERAKEEYIARWAEGETLKIREQHEDGLLARHEALKMIAASAFARAGFPDDFDYHLCRSSNCPCGVKDVRSLPAAVYPVWLALKVKLPEGSTFDFHTVREHIDEPDDDGETAGPTIYFVSLHLPVGPFTFDRDVQLN